MTGTISLSTSELFVDEFDGSATVSFKRVGDLSAPVQIFFEITADDAALGADVIASPGTVTIDAGSDEASVSFEIIDDAIAEETESFIVGITDISGGDLAAPRTTRVSILDDETPIVIEPEPPLVSNYDVTVRTVEELAFPMAAEFMPGRDNTMLVADGFGRLWTYDLETDSRQVFYDNRDTVNGVGQYGMTLHPDFANNPYVYVYYAVDPPDTAGQTGPAGPDGNGNRFMYISRITADADQDFTKAVPGSEVVLLGGAGQSLDDVSGGGVLNFDRGEVYADLPASDTINLTEEELALGLEYRQDFIKKDANHTGGAMAFGPDGMLYVSIGDHAAFNFADPRALSVQDVGSFNGKILRIDPLTGQGLTDNPFYKPGDSLDLNTSKVYQLGLRNPYSMVFTDDGNLMIGDTGHASYEEINTGAPGANFGWPFYEGADFDGLFVPPNFRPENGFEQEWQEFLAQDVDITAPFRGFSHISSDPGFQFIAMTGVGAIFDEDNDIYPDSLDGKLLFADYSQRNVFVVDPDNRLDLEFLHGRSDEGRFGPVRSFEGPDGRVYYIDPNTTFDEDGARKSGGIRTIDIVEIAPPVDNTIGAVVHVADIDHRTQTVEYGTTLDNPVLFASLSLNGVDAATVEFTDIGSDRSSMRIEEPAYGGGHHLPESASLLALEEGVWEVGADGRQLAVGTAEVPPNVTGNVNAGFVRVDFAQAFEQAPIVMTQIQSDSGDPEWAVARTKNIDATGFEVKVQEPEASDDVHAASVVGYAALGVDAAAAADAFVWSDLEVEAIDTGDTVAHRSASTWYDFGLDFDAAPLVVGSLATFNGNNTANMRIFRQEDDRVRMIAQEEKSLDDEVWHRPETVHGLAFEGEGLLSGSEYLLG